MRCYFHLKNGHSSILDETGIEVTDLQGLAAETSQVLEEMRQENQGGSEEWRAWQLVVTDPNGQILLSIPLMPTGR